MYPTKYTITTFVNGACEILLLDGIRRTSKPRRKIIYNTNDVVYFDNNMVIGIVDHHGILYGKRDLELDAIEPPKLSTETEAYLIKQQIILDLEKNPNCYDEYVKHNISGWDDKKDKIDINKVKKFFDIK